MVAGAWLAKQVSSVAKQLPAERAAQPVQEWPGEVSKCIELVSWCCYRAVGGNEEL